MKKYLSILVAVMLAAMAFTLTSCGDDDDDEPSGSENGKLTVNGVTAGTDEIGLPTSYAQVGIIADWGHDYDDSSIHTYIKGYGCGFHLHFVYKDVYYKMGLSTLIYPTTQKDDSILAQLKTYDWVKNGSIALESVTLQRIDAGPLDNDVKDWTGTISIVGKTKGTITLQFNNFVIDSKNADMDMIGDNEFRFNGTVSFEQW